MSDSPLLQEVIRNSIEAKLAEVNTAFPGRVEAYDSSNHTVDVRPLLKQRAPSVSGNGALEELPIIPDVPVAFPGGGGFYVTFPLEVGDTVMVVVSQRNIGEWWATGEVTDPKDSRPMPLDGAVAFPALRSSKAPAMTSVIDSDGSVWRVGGSAATEGIGLGDALQAHLDALESFINNHTHVYVPSGTGTPALTTPPTSKPVPPHLPYDTSPATPTVASKHKVEP